MTGCFSIFLVGVMMILGIAANSNVQQNAYDHTATMIAQTNFFVQTAIHATETAKAWTQTPTPTPTAVNANAILLTNTAVIHSMNATLTALALTPTPTAAK